MLDLTIFCTWFWYQIIVNLYVVDSFHCFHIHLTPFSTSSHPVVSTIVITGWTPLPNIQGSASRIWAYTGELDFLSRQKLNNGHESMFISWFFPVLLVKIHQHKYQMVKDSHSGSNINSIQVNSFILSPCKAWLQYIEIWYKKYLKILHKQNGSQNSNAYLAVFLFNAIWQLWRYTGQWCRGLILYIYFAEKFIGYLDRWQGCDFPTQQYLEVHRDHTARNIGSHRQVGKK